MSLRRRTLLFVLIFLSGNFVSSQIIPGKLPAAAESSSNFRGPTPPHISTADLISAAQRLLVKNCNNDYAPLPPPESPPIPTEAYYQEFPIEICPAPTFPICNKPQSYSTPLPSPASECLAAEPLSIAPQFTVFSKSPQFPVPSLPISPPLPSQSTLPAQLPQPPQLCLSQQSPQPSQLPQAPQCSLPPQLSFPSQLSLPQQLPLPPQIPYSPQLQLPQSPISPQLGPIYQSNYDCLEVNYQNPLPVESVCPTQPPCAEPQLLPEVTYDAYAQYLNSLQNTQSPINFQVSSIPVTYSCYGVATPCLNSLPKELSIEETFIPKFFTKFFADFFADCVPEPLIETPIVEVAPIVETIVEDLPCDINPTIVTEPAPLPVSLQINMPSPAEQPIILISAPNSAPVQEYNLSPISPPVPPPPPVIIRERSRSNSLKNLLPILLIAMSDNGCRNGGYGGYGNSGNNCGCSSCSVPFPFPIPIPVNNPVVCCRNKNNITKDSAPVDDDDVDINADDASN